MCFKLRVSQLSVTQERGSLIVAYLSITHFSFGKLHHEWKCPQLFKDVWCIKSISSAFPMRESLSIHSSQIEPSTLIYILWNNLRKSSETPSLLAESSRLKIGHTSCSQCLPCKVVDEAVTNSIQSYQGCINEAVVGKVLQCHHVYRLSSPLQISWNLNTRLR